MARRIFPPSKRTRELEARLADIESRSTNWDLKGTTLLDLIAESGGATVSPEEAIKNPAVLAAVSLRSRLIASLPKPVYKKTNDGLQEIKDHPLHNLLSYHPNPFMNAFTFWELVNTHLDLWGNAFVYISRYGGNVRALTPVHPRKVEVIVQGGKLFYKVSDTGDKVLDKTHSPDKFLHFKDISLDGVMGQSRVTLANKAIDIYQSAQSFGKEFFDKGGHAKGIIEMEGQMNPEAVKNFAEHWNQSGNHGTPILDMGKKYKQLDIPFADSQFKDVQEWCIQEIARAWDVPSSLINENSRSTFSNITHLDLQFTKYSMSPAAERYERELDFKLLGDKQGEETVVFNMDALLRGDIVSRAQWFSALKQNELYSSNEIRKMNGDNPSKDPKADLLQNPATTSNTAPNED